MNELTYNKCNFGLNRILLPIDFNEVDIVFCSHLFIPVDVILVVGVVFWSVKSVTLTDNLSATLSSMLLGQHIRVIMLWRGLPCQTSSSAELRDNRRLVTSVNV